MEAVDRKAKQEVNYQQKLVAEKSNLVYDLQI